LICSKKTLGLQSERMRPVKSLLVIVDNAID
jgi:hypothetical protein